MAHLVDDLLKNEAREVSSGGIQPLSIVGGGLAGCEAAWQAAQRGVDVTLYEMKPQRMSPAHRREGLAELTSLGVTWASAGVPGDSLAHALEALERYGETVITPGRAGDDQIGAS